MIQESDRQTDRRTPGDSKDRAYAYASHSKNLKKYKKRAIKSVISVKKCKYEEGLKK